MILDSLKSSKRIECIHPLFKQAFDYVKSTDSSKMENGKYEITDAGFMVSIASLFEEGKSEMAIEIHKRFIDIQFPLLGVEKIGWEPGDQLLEESVPYNEEQDIVFYIDKLTAYTKIYPEQFAIYFLEDGHAPGIGQRSIQKVVIRIPVQQYRTPYLFRKNDQLNTYMFYIGSTPILQTMVWSL